MYAKVVFFLAGAAAVQEADILYSMALAVA